MPALDDPTAKPKRTKRILLLTLGGVLGAFVLLVILGLVSQALGLNKKDSATTAATTTSAASAAAATPAPTPAPAVSSTAAPVVDCYPPHEITDPDLAAFAAGLQLPAGVQVVTGRVSTQHDKPGLVGVAIDLCVPASKNSDALRPIATDIAKALKGTDLGARTFALYVADMDPAYKTEAKIKDPDFKLHLWNGKPSTKVELSTWQVVTG
ncbi:hypothetical protein [Nocardia sp. NPDC059239]|uniref:hypothetical protein n=1 Tax=unclassified Nocardia TaxID=2637762 RepID=UPI0036A2BCA8